MIVNQLATVIQWLRESDIIAANRKLSFSAPYEPPDYAIATVGLREAVRC